MYDWGLIRDMAYRCQFAHEHAPKDIFTKIAIVLVQLATSALIILAPVGIVTTTVGGSLVVLTFGIAHLVFSLIWLPFWVLLLGTSWLWLHAWYLRPFLLVPGILIAIPGSLYIMLAPETERDAKDSKLSLAQEWPLSWYLMKPPTEYYEWIEPEASEG